MCVVIIVCGSEVERVRTRPTPAHMCRESLWSKKQLPPSWKIRGRNIRSGWTAHHHGKTHKLKEDNFFLQRIKKKKKKLCAIAQRRGSFSFFYNKKSSFPILTVHLVTLSPVSSNALCWYTSINLFLLLLLQEIRIYAHLWPTQPAPSWLLHNTNG